MASLNELKYPGMTIPTTHDSLRIIDQRSQRAVEAATRRGIILADKRQIIDEEPAGGRLPHQVIPSLAFPTTQEVADVAQVFSARRPDTPRRGGHLRRICFGEIDRRAGSLPTDRASQAEGARTKTC